MSLFCDICGKEFNSIRALTLHIPRAHSISVETYYMCVFDKDPNVCPVCGNNTKFKSFKDGYREYCSAKCASIGTVNKRRSVSLNKYGVENPMQAPEIKQRYKTVIKSKYSVDNVSQIDSVKDKKVKTSFKHYNVDNPSKSDVIKTKRKYTYLKRFGVDNPNKCRNVRYKVESTVKKRYNVSCVFESDIIKTKIERKLKPKHYYNVSSRLTTCEIVTPLDNYNGVLDIYEFKCLSCGNIFTGSLRSGREPKCKRCYKSKTSIEQKIADLLDYLGVEYYFGYRKFKPFELDFYIPNHNVAIEVNGLYWHSETRVGKLYPNPKKYHLDKTNLCNDNGVLLLHFFEDEINFKFDIVTDIIMAKLGMLNKFVGARECNIDYIKPKLANKFLECNHIHGRSYGKCIYIGSFFKNVLVGVMVFKKGNIAHKNRSTIELDKFCTINCVNIPGLASKMFKFFCERNSFSKIVTYADLRFSNGNVYKWLDFCVVSQTPPNYFYIIDGVRKHRFSYRKSELKNKLDVFDNNKTEYENMLLNRYDRIWDCGHLKLEHNSTV